MTQQQCVTGCGRPAPDGPACTTCARQLADTLRNAAGHAEDAWTVIARQTRYSTAGGTRTPEPEPAGVAADLRRNRVTEFGWAASVERPVAGGLRPEPVPADLGALDRLHAAENTITTWARILGADVAGLSAACMWLAEHVAELQHHPAAGEAFGQLHAACAQLERLVDRPPGGHRLVGMCDCGRTLYAPHGRDVVQCKPCGAKWNVTESQAILLKHLDGRLVTVPEALDMAGWLDTDRTREQIRKLITGWTKRGQLAAHGTIWRDPTDAETRTDPEAYQVAVPLYRFGEIRARLADTPRRNREGAAA